MSSEGPSDIVQTGINAVWGQTLNEAAIMQASALDVSGFHVLYE